MSSGAATRPSGTSAARSAATDASWYAFSVMPVRTIPGDTEFTRMPSRPNSWASTRISMITAALLGA